MPPTLDQLLRARVPSAVVNYYLSRRNRRTAWYNTRQWIEREFRGIDSKVVDQLLVTCRHGIKEAKKLNAQIRRLQRGTATA